MGNGQCTGCTGVKQPQKVKNPQMWEQTEATSVIEQKSHPRESTPDMVDIDFLSVIDQIIVGKTFTEEELRNEAHSLAKFTMNKYDTDQNGEID